MIFFPVTKPPLKIVSDSFNQDKKGPIMLICSSPPLDYYETFPLGEMVKFILRGC